ncbi:hypothetical protein [Pedosphaera parvula]|uniref:Uncharacterized protein n=1 Tax=Pedosphaera parvula (strain Ellin514) TaxID=320771 RepID=B9XLQ9_PEDPL|nr:hypothetical protein [Pedosphaera parvula]EEF59166.1 hypothetical protein Cflav_PD2371 [Pedosphaera parvula Ellin514]
MRTSENTILELDGVSLHHHLETERLKIMSKGFGGEAAAGGTYRQLTAVQN